MRAIFPIIVFFISICPFIESKAQLFPPIATNDGATTQEDTPVTINILNNDYDLDILTGTIEPATVDLDPSTGAFETSVTSTSGTFTVNSSGVVTFTPALNFTGPASITYTVNDNYAVKSNVATISVTVTPVNDAPVITAFQSGLTTIEDTPLSLQLSHLTIEDPDNASFTIAIVPGDNYSASGNVVTPAPNYNGMLQVSVTVSDGTATSTPVVIPVSVTAQNDPPVISGQNPVSTNEDTPVTILLSHLVFTDVDNATNFSIVLADGPNYSISGTTVTPDNNYSGELQVPVYISDGTDNSNTIQLEIQVNAVSDAPVITGQTAVATPEDTPLALLVSMLTVVDPDNASFTLIVTDGTGYSVSGTTITPDKDLSGPITVQVQVSDGTHLSNTFPLEVQVTPVNDTPVISGQTPISIAEDNPFTLTLAHLTIVDPDNSSFTLSVIEGIHYSLSGNTITPEANYFGPLVVPVQVSDGTNNSAAFNVQITVTPVNDLPVITGQLPLSTPEDTGLTLRIADLTITDADNASGFTLNISPGTNYSVNGAVIQPAANYSGPLTVPVSVSDGSGSSNTFNVLVTVTAVNDPPVITGQIPISAEEDQAVTILLSHLTVSDPDDTYPADFTLTVLNGDGYTRVGNTITPAANFTGPLTVLVRVNDGTANSTPDFNLKVDINPVNDAPQITGQNALSTPEETAITLQPSNLVIVDPDNTTGFVISVSPGENYTFEGTVITPNLNFSGTLTVPVKVADAGNLSSNEFDLKIQVTPVNDAPVLTGQKAVSTAEDTPITLNLSHVVYTDVDNTTGLTLVVSPGSNYTVSGAVVTPALNFTGELTIPVMVSDGTANSNPLDLKLQVTPVNDVPQITAQQTLTIAEDGSLALTLGHLTVVDPDNNYPADFTLTVKGGPNYTVSNGVVTPNANYYGQLTVPVQVRDGASDSPEFSVKITVTPVNDAPSITGHVPLATNEDQPITLQLAHLTVTDPDNTYPTGFALTALPGENYTVSGNQVRPNSNYFGSLFVSVQVSDGTANSPAFAVRITVHPVNDAPVITGQTTVATGEDQPILITLSHITATDVESSFPTGFTLEVLAGTGYTISGNTVTPAQNFNGNLAVNVRVSDGQTNSATFSLTVTVTPVNDVPVITAQKAISTPEETALTILVSHLTISDVDNASGFDLSVSAGSNYTVSDNTITPDKDYNGSLTIPVQVRDAGGLASNVFSLTVQVTAVNDAPVILGQKSILATDEDVPITLKVSDLTILDPDNTSFTIQILPGTSYTASGSVITPALDFNGTINVNTRVSDGTASSATFVVQIQVGDANDPPVITKQVPLSVDEDASITLSLSHFTVTDPDNTYPGDFTLRITQGANYTVSGTTVKPNDNYFGTLTVPVSVNDGVNNSALFNATITVNAINDPPSFDPIPNMQIAENSGEHFVTIQNISKGALEASQSIIFVASSGNTSIFSDPEVSYNGTGPTAELSFTVKPNVSGVVMVTVRAIDNGSPAGTFVSTFQVEVMDVNAAPTLQTIAAVTVAEDSPVREINLSGISAGPGESQPLTVTVTTNKPELFDPLPEVVYQSPNATGLLRVTPKANAFGTASISVTVTDNGSATAPNVNKITRSFSFTITPVNDKPVIESTPVTVGVVGENYAYELVVEDVENEDITFTFPSAPAWLKFTPTGQSTGTVSGIPVVGGPQPISIVARDASGATATQNYVIDVNTRPDLSVANLATAEDQEVVLPVTTVFFDADGDSMTELKLTAVPEHGVVLSGTTVLEPGTPVPSSSFGDLVYRPSPNYTGNDTVRFMASDGKHYSLSDTYIALTMTPSNDAPVITFIETDTLDFEVNGEPAFITAEIVVEDPDDVTLTGADIAFTRLTYRRDDDVLLFENTGSITGNFDAASGVLVLTGEATVAEYIQALRSIQYNYLEPVDPVLEQKTITISLTDGKLMGPPRERHVMLTYSFTDLAIPSAFTPNGDQVNDTWYIAPEGGDLENAVIRVFNPRGFRVYESTGFTNPWDGTFNGELVPPGTYFYTIDLKLINQKTYKGTVTILY